MQTSDLLTLLVALYGAILSTVIFLRERQKENRTLRVSCKVSFGVSHMGTTGRYISIEAVNVGHRPVTITQAGLRSNTKEILIPIVNDPNFYPIPKKLEDGDPVMVYIALDDIINAAKEKKIRYTRAFVQDAEGKIYLAPLPKAFKELSLAK